MLFTLAIRNIFRNKRRTIITIGAVAFAVFLASFMRSFQKGAWDNVIGTSVNSFYGYAQVHKQGYWEDKSLDNSVELNDQLKSLTEQIKNIEDYAPRMESFALASMGNKTHGVAVIGVDPNKEDKLTNLAEKVIQGEYLKNGDFGALVAEGVSKKLGLEVGDSLVLISQGFRAANAAGKYPIRGIVKYGLPDINKRMVFLNLPAAQGLYAAPNRVTGLAMKIAHQDMVPKILKDLKSTLPDAEYEVMGYQEMLPELMQARQLDEGGSTIILGILYALITFAIFGTILMMTKERSYEFGVLTTIGMRRLQLFSIVWLETILVSFIGAIIGALLATPLVYYLHVNPLDMTALGEEAVATYEKFGMEPIIPAAFEASLFLKQGFIIFIVTCILGLYPLWKIMKLHPVEAMRDV